VVVDGNFVPQLSVGWVCHNHFLATKDADWHSISPTSSFALDICPGFATTKNELLCNSV